MSTLTKWNPFRSRSEVATTINLNAVSPSEAWRQKMALLDEIHEQILPQLTAMRLALEDTAEPEDFLDCHALNPARHLST